MNTHIHVSGTSERNNQKNRPSIWQTRKPIDSEGREMCLGAGATIHFDGDVRGMKIKMLIGKVWITQEGDLDDYVLTSGEEFVVSKAGKIVVEGVGESILRIASTRRNLLN